MIPYNPILGTFGIGLVILWVIFWLFPRMKKKNKEDLEKKQT